ncbi:MAG: hypothetical protein O0X96_04715 [Methanocorpusculum sp.]|nr:hypothetical protein [Methanocorpusculum sp.]
MINTYIISEINIPDYGDQHLPRKMQLMPDICMDCTVGHPIRDRSSAEEKTGTFPEQVRFRQMPRWQ